MSTVNLLQEKAQAIAPCNRKMPYVYVCYSTRDGIAVYDAVRALQESGENLWIDVPQNFNTGEGYNSTIFHAIDDFQCRGILFFMSEDSFTSAQSAKEMAYLKADEVVRKHGEPLGVVGVELVEIEHHDVEIWVNGPLYQKLEQAPLSPIEAERVEKYRNKYNQKIERVETKFDLAESILGNLMQGERARVEYEENVNIEAVKKALTAL